MQAHAQRLVVAAYEILIKVKFQILEQVYILDKLNSRIVYKEVVCVLIQEKTSSRYRSILELTVDSRQANAMLGNKVVFEYK